MVYIIQVFYKVNIIRNNRTKYDKYLIVFETFIRIAIYSWFLVL